MSRLNFFCRGAGPGCNTREISDKLVNVQDELEELNRQETELDQLKLRIQQSIKNVNDEVSNSRYPLSCLEKQVCLCRCFTSQSTNFQSCWDDPPFLGSTFTKKRIK